MLAATALVILMTPALGLFYAGLVRSKNTLNTFMMSIAALGVATIAWAVIGYSLAFGGEGGFIGNFDYAFLKNVGFEPAEGAFGGQSLAGALRGSDSLPQRRPIYLQRRHFRPGKLRPDLLEKLPDGRAVPFVSVEGEQFALRRGRWKLILAPDEAAPKLYDLRSDPEERTNLAVAELQHSVRLREQLEAWIEAQRSVAPEAGRVSEEDRARLRALGYAD